MALISRRYLSGLHSIKPSLIKLQSFCSTCLLIICLILFILSLLAVAFKPLNTAIHVVVIDNEKPISHVVNSRFLSVALDSSLIAKDFPHFNLTNRRIYKLLKPLAPAYLRIGGTMADRLWFESERKHKYRYLDEIDGAECANDGRNCDIFGKPNFTMSDKEWLQLNKLAKASELIILFDLNCLIRFNNGSWNSENAEKLINFSDSHHLNVNWELGNEPDAFKHTFNYEVSATQLAKDFYKLRNILNKHSTYKNSLLVGPDTTRPIKNNSNKSSNYFKQFIQEAGQYLDGFTWHHYYFNGRTARPSDFLNPNIFNSLKTQIDFIKKMVVDAGMKTKHIWLGETSSAYGGGVPGLSDTYISTFIWLDKLGLSARNGLDLVIRQTLHGGNYGLIDDELEPTPDWWVSVMYKTFVGPEVVPCKTMSSPEVRLYCHCTRESILHRKAQSVTIFGFNMKNGQAKIKIENSHSRVFAYILSPYLTLLSRYVLLNGEILYLLPNGDLLPFVPKVVDSKPYLRIPPYSLAFWIVPNISNHC